MESSPEENAEGLAIVRVLAAVLDRLVCANAPLARTEACQVTKFHALKAPAIGIQQYLERSVNRRTVVCVADPLTVLSHFLRILLTGSTSMRLARISALSWHSSTLTDSSNGMAFYSRS
jgi:hypothetical protein